MQIDDTRKPNPKQFKGNPAGWGSRIDEKE